MLDKDDGHAGIMVEMLCSEAHAFATIACNLLIFRTLPHRLNPSNAVDEEPPALNACEWHNAAGGHTGGE